jgi:hypothetical protein
MLINGLYLKNVTQKARKFGCVGRAMIPPVKYISKILW